MPPRFCIASSACWRCCSAAHPIPQDAATPSLRVRAAGDEREGWVEGQATLSSPHVHTPSARFLPLWTLVRLQPL
eukprot:352958-Chlamydomonas_euryale.AAC.3